MTDSFIQIVCPSCSAINRVPSLKLNDHPLCGKCKKGLLSAYPIMANDQNFSRFIEKNDLPVVVDFWASWCGPCQQFAPVFSQVSDEMAAQACFVKLDTENNQITASRYQGESMKALAA